MASNTNNFTDEHAACALLKLSQENFKRRQAAEATEWSQGDRQFEPVDAAVDSSSYSIYAPIQETDARWFLQRFGEPRFFNGHRWRTFSVSETFELRNTGQITENDFLEALGHHNANTQEAKADLSLLDPNRPQTHPFILSSPEAEVCRQRSLRDAGTYHQRQSRVEAWLDASIGGQPSVFRDPVEGAGSLPAYGYPTTQETGLLRNQNPLTRSTSAIDAVVGSEDFTSSNLDRSIIKQDDHEGFSAPFSPFMTTRKRRGKRESSPSESDESLEILMPGDADGTRTPLKPGPPRWPYLRTRLIHSNGRPKIAKYVRKDGSPIKASDFQDPEFCRHVNRWYRQKHRRSGSRHVKIHNNWNAVEVSILEMLLERKNGRRGIKGWREITDEFNQISGRRRSIVSIKSFVSKHRDPGSATRATSEAFESKSST